MILFAVHLSDGTVLWPWQAAGFVLAALLALWGAWRITDEEIPRVALLTSAFFVVSLIHIPAGPTSVHLLLNGLLGVILGRRVCLAIPIGLLLQALLLQHGGYGTLGLNSCIFVLPALAASAAFTLLGRRRAASSPRCSLFVVRCSLFIGFPIAEMNNEQRTMNHEQVARSPEFLTLLGAALGAFTALATVSLNGLVLYFGGQEEWPAIVTFVFVAHLPVVIIETVVVGSVVGYIARVKPDLLGLPIPEAVECAVESAP
jgi:cobalt/nickel transport system permease protein